MKTALRAVTRLNRMLLWVACTVLAASTVMAVANMILRPLKMPIQGSFELMGLGGALIVALTLGASQESRSHIAVDILFNRFPARLQAVLVTVGNLACAAFFGVAAWQMARFGVKLLGTGEVSETLGLPTYPVVFAVAAGLAAMALTLLVTCAGGNEGDS